MPGLMPPPAIHMVKACGWWSRPRLRPERGVGLDHRRAAELAAPDHQRVVEQAALLQVLDQRRATAWSVAPQLVFEVAGDVGVGVPALVVDVDEPDAALDQPPGQQAGAGERRLVRLGAVQVERLLASRSCRSISSGARGLQPEGHLVGGDARGDLRVADGVRGAAGSASPIRSSESRCSCASMPGGAGDVRGSGRPGCGTGRPV